MNTREAKHAAESGRLIAVGDIHGHLELLEDLLRQIAPQPEDRLVFLGDYVDRGPAAAGVIDTLIEFQRLFPGTIFLRGNHEQMLLDARRTASAVQPFPAVLQRMPGFRKSALPAEIAFYLECGGHDTVQDYGRRCGTTDPCAVLRQLPEHHVRFLEQTRMFHRQDPYLFVHAGVNPRDPWGEGPGAADLLWLRQAPWRCEPDWTLTVVHGHTPVPEPRFHRLEVILDTGAGHQGPLSACDLYSGRIWQSRPGASDARRRRA